MSAPDSAGPAARWVHYFCDPPPANCTDLKSLLGGKGASLKELSRAGLNVPPGFTIVPECCAHYFANHRAWPDGLEAEVRANLHRLERDMGCVFGSRERPLLVSVRSGAAVSMPGMMDTVLNVGQTGDAWPQLVDCINAVFDSWQSERACAYRQRHDIEGLPGTACSVQAMFPSQVSGVLFTRDPRNTNGDHLLIEAAHGLGENVVSGAVMPDRFVVRRSDLACIDREIHENSCLTDPQIAELATLALRVETYYGHPVDLEWGLAEGRFALLQARAIRGLSTASIETVRLEEIARLKQLAGGQRKVWVQHNLSETLPFPTPLTWDIVRHFMRGDGGFGRLYQSLGHRPSRAVREQGFLELIGGRVYADPQRLSELFWDGLPLAYDADALLADPSLLDQAPLRFDPDRASGRFLTTLPANLWGMWHAGRNMARAARQARQRFERLLPSWLEYVKRERERDLNALSDAELIELLQQRIRCVLDEFGPESLRPGFFGGLAFDRLRATLGRFLGTAEGNELADALTRGGEHDTTIEQDLLLEQVAHGRASLAEFLDRYGHRAAGEMELAQPRWGEDPEALKPLIAHLQSTQVGSVEARHQETVSRQHDAETSLPARLRDAGCGSLKEQIDVDIPLARELLPFRETGKHYLMLGYELLRQATEALASRWELGRDIYFLQLSELPLFVGWDKLAQRAPAHQSGEPSAANAALSHPTDVRSQLRDEINQRRQRWELLQQLDWPPAIDSRKLDDLGRHDVPQAVDQMQGHAMAGGVATGIAAVVFNPRELPSLPTAYILVCPSTDPGWTPLFMNARGLIVERGGVLSHGAIVARDFGIPAVACPGATKLLRAGDTLRVDGNAGAVYVLKRAAD